MAAPRNELDRVLYECKMQNILPLKIRCQFFLEGEEKQIFYILNPESFYSAEFLKVQMEHLKDFIEELVEKETRQPYQLILLGYGYEKGLGVDKDIKKAIAYYTEAADLKSSLGNAMLGRLYDECFDFSRAQNSIRLATDQNNPLAERQTGLSYISGRGVTQLPDEAVKWLTKAAIQDDPIAQCELGTLLEEKKGDENIAAAKEHFKAAARNGNIDAVAKLGLLLNDLSLAYYACEANNKFGFYCAGLMEMPLTMPTKRLLRMTGLQGLEKTLLGHELGMKFIIQAAELGCAEAYYHIFDFSYFSDFWGFLDSKFIIQAMTGTYSHLLTSSDAKEHLNGVPLEKFSYFMNEKDFKEIYEERSKTKVSCVVALHYNLKKAGKEIFDPALVKLVTEFISTPQQPVRDSVLAEFKTANDIPLVQRAQAFLEGDHSQAFYFFTRNFYTHKRRYLEEETIPLAELMISLKNLNKPLTTEQQILLGFGYEKGMGVPKDEKSAIEYYRTAAESLPLGDTALAKLYAARQPNAHDLFLNHCQLAAEREEPMAMCELAAFNLYGDGNNPAEGLAWLFKSAEAQYPPAQLLFALELLRQPFTKKETLMLRAKDLMENAAKAGLPAAIFQLGKFYMAPGTTWSAKMLPAVPNWMNRMYATPRRALDYFTVADQYLDYSLQEERELGDLYMNMCDKIYSLALTSPSQHGVKYHSPADFDNDLFNLRRPAFLKGLLHFRHLIERNDPSKEIIIDWIRNALHPMRYRGGLLQKFLPNRLKRVDETFNTAIDYHIALITNNPNLLFKVAKNHPDGFRECLSYEFSLENRERICSILPPDIRKKFIAERRVLQRPERVIETKHEAVNLKDVVETKTESKSVAALEERQQQQPQQATPPETKRKPREKQPTAGDIAHAQITAEHESEMKERFAGRKNRLLQFVEELQKQVGDQLTTADLSQSIYARGSGTLFQSVREPVLKQLLLEFKNENPDFDQIKIRIADIINEFKSKLIQEELPDSSNKLNHLIEFLFADTAILKNPSLFEKAKYLLIKPDQIEWCAKNLESIMQKRPDIHGKP